jgi:hypothetical protein
VNGRGSGGQGDRQASGHCLPQAELSRAGIAIFQVFRQHHSQMGFNVIAPEIVE